MRVVVSLIIFFLALVYASQVEQVSLFFSKYEPISNLS
jgi:hypothetical protein